MPSQIPLTNIYNTDGLVKGDAGVLANAKSLEDLMVFNIDAPFGFCHATWSSKLFHA